MIVIRIIMCTPIDKQRLLNLYTKLQKPAAENKAKSKQTIDKQPAQRDSSPAQHTLTRQQLRQVKLDKYPHLEDDDARLTMYDTEIIERDIAYEDCVLHTSEQPPLKALLNKYKQAFSLHAEVGDTGITVDFDLNDKTPFYIRPFTVAQSD